MKKLLLFLAVILSLTFVGCQKEELTTEEYIFCNEQRENSTKQLNYLLSHGSIGQYEYQQRLKQISIDYNHCIKDGKND